MILLDAHVVAGASSFTGASEATHLHMIFSTSTLCGSHCQQEAHPGPLLMPHG